MSESSVRPGPDLGARSPLLGEERHSPLNASQAEPPRPPALRGIDSLGFVMDVPVAVTVELGRRTVKIAEVLRLGPGSVLERPFSVPPAHPAISTTITAARRHLVMAAP